MEGSHAADNVFLQASPRLVRGLGDADQSGVLHTQMYKGHIVVGPSAGVRVDRRMVQHDAGGRAQVRAEDAGRDQREGPFEESEFREAGDDAHVARVVGTSVAVAQFPVAVRSLVVLLVIATDRIGPSISLFRKRDSKTCIRYLCVYIYKKRKKKRIRVRLHIQLYGQVLLHAEVTSAKPRSPAALQRVASPRVVVEQCCILGC